ncbi:MAG: hypothetical protein AABX13_04525 [Nanoarchaeota archaeon]
MSLEKLLYNPEKYRCGNNYLATNLVYPVEFAGQKYVVKRIRPLHSLLANIYYTFQDRFLFGTRQLATPWLCLEIEAKKLRYLNGVGTPKLVHFNGYGDTLIREYIPGILFGDLSSDQQRQQTLEGALASLEQIHEQNVVVGDAQVKNVLASSQRSSQQAPSQQGHFPQAYWLDLEGLFDESDLRKAKAADVLKFIYSTYTVTRDVWAALSTAELVVKQYHNIEVKQQLPLLAAQLVGNLGLWFSTRLPRDGKLHRDIQRVLRG